MAIGFDYLPDGQQMSSPRMLKRHISAGMALVGLAMLAGAVLGNAQYPGQVTKPDKDTQQMRAVAVLEWTGDEAHPKTSRLIPVSVYDGQDLQDAGIYLARPAPLALMSEVEYELLNNGKTVGLFDVSSAGQQYGAWIGFGAWKPLPKPKPAMQAAASTGKDIWGNDDDGDRPVLHRKHHDDDSTGSGSDSGQPTLHKKSSDDSGSDSGSNAPAPDPDRPTLHKKTSDDASGDSSSGPAPDPDRPTLKKKADNPKKQADVGSVESVATLTDPERPRLLRGKPANVGGDVLPTLMGLPPDMHQAVAVSDARNRPEHLWSYSWANPEDEAKMKAEIEDLARKALGIATAPPPTPAPAAKPGTKKAAAQKTRLTLPPEPVPLRDEQFRVFELAYGAGATMVLSARTDGEGAQEKFVTLVCQTDLYGNVIVLLKNVTDAAHLDDTPRMRLVDAVDALADNRGELLFELRGATQRQFALYRVLRGQVDKLFVSGPGAIGPAAGESHS